MKKIIFMLIIYFMFIGVNALEYGVWTDEITYDEDVRLVSSEVRYRWYKNIDVISSDYYIEGENSSLYPDISYDHFYTTEWSEWLDERPVYKQNRVVQEKPAKRYRTLRPIRYLFLDGFENFNSNTKITKISVLIDAEKIPINLTCNNCPASFNELVMDDFDNTGVDINNETVIMIDLGNYYGIEKIELEVFLQDVVCETKKFSVHYNEGLLIDDRNYAIKDVEYTTKVKSPIYIEKISIKPDASSITNPVYGDWIYVEDPVNTTYYRRMQFLTVYRYKDTLYKYTGVVKDYLEGYYAVAPDLSYIRDDDSAKTFYIYEYASSADKTPQNDKKQEPEDQKENAEHNREESFGKKSKELNSNKKLVLNPKEEEITKKEDKIAGSIDIQNHKDDKKSLVAMKQAKNIDFKIFMIGFSVVILICILIFIIRHHILSHQK
ncbi:MAG TPA: hypothetical protein GXZ95_03160 [Mollicutes bacterium]|nr:hypothetical protein [Mollicutes bacterium]